MPLFATSTIPMITGMDSKYSGKEPNVTAATKIVFSKSYFQYLNYFTVHRYLKRQIFAA
jgi:hypothetical protein